MAKVIHGKSGIKAALHNDMANKMSRLAKQVKIDMQEETWDFYSGGSPEVYQRTGHLGNTPEVSPIESTLGSIEFTAYLNQDYTYGTGDNPSMTQVLDLANSGIPWTTKRGGQARPTVGKSGFWERAQDRMDKSWNSIMKK